METITLATAIVGAVCGILGAVLGIINTWSQLSRNRVRLKVIPKVAITMDAAHMLVIDRPGKRMEQLAASGRPGRLCVQVINLSTFPVTVSDVGFGRVDRVRGIIIQPELADGKKWPVRLEPREAMTAYARPGENLDPEMMKPPVAYAKTDCGVVQYGTSLIIKEYVRQLRVCRGQQS